MWVPRILVIDDEPLVALLVRRTLEDAHEVSVESSARTAIGRIAGGERWDAILADLHLPDRDAEWLRDELGRVDPALPARLLVLTGGATTEKARAFLQDPTVRWLQKPFRAVELLDAVNALLSGAAPATR
jgi:DNA-binding NtrC family response regulator